MIAALLQLALFLVVAWLVGAGIEGAYRPDAPSDPGPRDVPAAPRDPLPVPAASPAAVVVAAP